MISCRPKSLLCFDTEGLRSGNHGSLSSWQTEENGDLIALRPLALLWGLQIELGGRTSSEEGFCNTAWADKDMVKMGRPCFVRSLS